MAKPWKCRLALQIGNIRRTRRHTLTTRSVADAMRNETHGLPKWAAALSMMPIGRTQEDCLTGRILEVAPGDRGLLRAPVNLREGAATRGPLGPGLLTPGSTRVMTG
jgi:hypothetical protein